MDQKDISKGSKRNKIDNASDAILKLLLYIKAHKFAPGDRLPSERTLAEKFGMGRGAIREALVTLEFMRVIDRRPNSGSYLRNQASEGSLETLVIQNNLGLPLTEKDVREAMEVRHILELQALPIACERRTEEDLQRIRKALDESEERIKLGQTIDKQDWGFHISIVAASKNDILVRVVNAFYFLSMNRRKIYFSDMHHCKQSNAQHRRIYKAIEAQDSKLALELMEQHLGKVERDWKKALSNS